MSATYPTTRLRRLRHNKAVRQLVREHQLTCDDLIYPLFIKHGTGANTSINSMPSQYQITLENLPKEINELVALNINAVLLFGLPETKDATGSDAYNDNGIVQQAIKVIKMTAPDLLIISDICCCEYTDHGHCGIMDDHTGCMDVNNDQTLELLQQQALSHAKAGADILAPSGMMDGMVQAMRTTLDANDFAHLPILSYTAKYASHFYGPFREAAGGSPEFGDRRSHQMDFSNGDEALREAELDVQEGADMLMVKPGLAYLDIIQRLKQTFPGVPLCAYQVSGEYSMIKAASANGWVDEMPVVLETMLAFKRAGATMIITYFAKDIAKTLRLN